MYYRKIRPTCNEKTPTCSILKSVNSRRRCCAVRSDNLLTAMVVPTEPLAFWEVQPSTNRRFRATLNSWTERFWSCDIVKSSGRVLWIREGSCLRVTPLPNPINLLWLPLRLPSSELTFVRTYIHVYSTRWNAAVGNYQTCGRRNCELAWSLNPMSKQWQFSALSLSPLQMKIKRVSFAGARPSISLFQLTGNVGQRVWSSVEMSIRDLGFS